MAKPRGSKHTTLTETASTVVAVLERLPGIKMIAPGEIKRAGQRRAGAKTVTAVFTTSGCELIITGQSVQRVAVHTVVPAQAVHIITMAKTHKSLRGFRWSTRSRKPGI